MYEVITFQNELDNVNINNKSNKKWEKVKKYLNLVKKNHLKYHRYLNTIGKYEFACTCKFSSCVKNVKLLVVCWKKSI